MDSIETMQTDPTLPIKLFKRRWLMLCVFVLAGITSGFQMIHYAYISEIMVKYYHITSMAVSWLTTVYMVSYLVFLLPLLWLLEKQTFRFILILASFTNSLGTSISCVGVQPHLFSLVMIGQIISSTSGIIFLMMPAPIAAVWFGSSEVSTATAIGVFGFEFGAALGCLLPPIIVHDSDNISDITTQLSYMSYGTAGTTFLFFLLIVLFFQSEPSKSPSIARWKVKNSTDKPKNLIKSIVSVINNRDIGLLCTSYGITISVFYGFEALLSQNILFYFQGEAENAGRMGLVLVIMGNIGALAGGIWLDKTHAYKKTTAGFIGLSLICLAVYTIVVTILPGNYIWLLFLIIALFGFFIVGVIPMGLEFGAEIAYPQPEGISSGVLLGFAQLFAIIVIIGGQALLDFLGALALNIALTCLLLCSTIIMFCIKGKLKRLQANEST